MPHKSVREMNIFEKTHHSIATRTFRMILACAIVISIAALCFGIFIYSDAVKNQYVTIAHNIAKMPSMVFDQKDAEVYAKNVLDVYASLPEELAANPESEEYLTRFKNFENAEYQRIRALLNQIQQKNEAYSIYLGAIDKAHNRLIYLVDSDMNDTYCPVGYWEELTDDEIFRYIDPSVEVPADIAHTERYGYLCTSGVVLFEVGDYSILSFTDISMDDVISNSWEYLFRYIDVILLTGILTAWIFAWIVRRKVSKPINSLSETAIRYSESKGSEDLENNYFDKLNIRTGDEIENLSLIMADMEKDVKNRIKEIQRVTAEKERINSELALATKIQASMLPNVYPPFPKRTEFEIFASMTPAKEVGGDFYDFFLIDDDHLGMMIADVSGKGVPAALFMMASKILIENLGLAGHSPAEVLRRANEQICKANNEDMFVTVWYGILEISTGKVVAANAGHERPIVRQPDGCFELMEDPHSLFLGGFDFTKFKEYEFTMEKGATLFLYTDGIPESINAENEEFGLDRMLQTLNRTETDTPKELITALEDEVTRYSEGMTQFDDLTMLSVKIN